MRGIVVLCFLLVLPIFAVLGHDIYVTYQDQDFTKPMMFSDVGYLWTNYEPDTYEWARKNIDPGTWEHVVTPFLEQTSVIMAAVPALVVFTLLLILRLFKLPPFAPEVKVKKGHKKSDFSFGSGDRGKGKERISYKRK
jgi:hypothetical protein